MLQWQCFWYIVLNQMLLKSSSPVSFYLFKYVATRKLIFHVRLTLYFFWTVQHYIMSLGGYWFFPTQISSLPYCLFQMGQRGATITLKQVIKQKCCLPCIPHEHPLAGSLHFPSVPFLQILIFSRSWFLLAACKTTGTRMGEKHGRVMMGDFKYLGLHRQAHSAEKWSIW